jgi:hypothetical protein
MNKIIDTVVFLSVIILIAVSLFLVPIRIVSYIDSNSTLHYSDEYMTGAEDFVVFCMGGFIFLPLFVEMAISLVRKKENENIRMITHVTQ